MLPSESMIQYKASLVGKILDKYLADKGYNDYFIGGSYRFGWLTKQSDYDLFILEKNPSDGLLPKITTISDLNLHCVTPNCYPGQHWETEIFGNQIDLIFFYNKDVYQSLYEEHLEIETYLQNNPEVSDILSIVQCTNQDKYRALKLRVS